MKVTILCGESPLPVCQALRTLGATEVVIIHGPNTYKHDVTASEHVKKYCIKPLGIKEKNIHLQEINPWSIHSIYDSFRKSNLLDESTLVFGPGTAVMNATIRDTWMVKKGNDYKQQQAWYLQATPSQLIPYNPQILEDSNLPSVLPVVATGLNLKGLTELHLFSNRFIVNGGKPLEGTIKGWFENNRLSNDLKIESSEDLYNLLPPLVSEILYSGYGMRLNKEKDLTLIEDTNAFNLLRGLGLPTLPGFLLEIAVYAFFAEHFPCSEIVHSFKVTRPTPGGTEGIVEIDIVIRHNDKVVWISCGSKQSAGDKAITGFRNKFHEVKANAIDLAGKEARSITVVNRLTLNNAKNQRKIAKVAARINFGNDLRSRLNLKENPTPQEKHIVVDLAELLGGKFRDSNKQIETVEWLKEWIKVSLGLEEQKQNIAL